MCNGEWFGNMIPPAPTRIRQVRSATCAIRISGAVLTTLHTYSNLDHATGYAQHSFSLSNYAGQKITLKFTGSEDFEMQTSFVLDDTALNVS